MSDVVCGQELKRVGCRKHLKICQKVLLMSKTSDVYFIGKGKCQWLVQVNRAPEHSGRKIEDESVRQGDMAGFKGMRMNSEDLPILHKRILSHQEIRNTTFKKLGFSLSW